MTSTGRSPTPWSRLSDFSGVNQRPVTCSGDGYGDCGRFESVRTESSTKLTTVSVWCACSLSVTGPLRTRPIRAERQSPNKDLMPSCRSGRFEFEGLRPNLAVNCGFGASMARLADRAECSR